MKLHSTIFAPASKRHSISPKNASIIVVVVEVEVAIVVKVLLVFEAVGVM